MDVNLLFKIAAVGILVTVIGQVLKHSGREEREHTVGIIQISMLGIGAVVLALLLKQQKSEYALYLSLAAVILILIFSMNRLQVVMETIQKIEQYTGIDAAMLKILVKLMGITYVAEFASGICKDAGFSAIGSQIEMFAKFSIMAVSVPVLLTLLETIEGLLGA